jgi:hypothetical protein
VHLECNGSVISSVDFASYGQPSGTCGSYSLGSCHSKSSLAVVQNLCLNRSSCTIPMASFDPPHCQHPYLAVQVCALRNLLVMRTLHFGTVDQVACADRQPHTYWNFADMDQQFLAFWGAFQGETSEPIVGFCTAPSWMYDSKNYTFVDDPSTWW